VRLLIENLRFYVEHFGEAAFLLFWVFLGYFTGIGAGVLLDRMAGRKAELHIIDGVAYAVGNGFALLMLQSVWAQFALEADGNGSSEHPLVRLAERFWPLTIMATGLVTYLLVRLIRARPTSKPHPEPR
jgi:hypothetical protein